MVSSDDISKIALLANIEVSEQEGSKLATELGSILDYVNQLEKVETGEVQALSHVHGVTNVFREDELSEKVDKRKYLENTPDPSGDFIRVPIVIDQDTK